MSEFGSVCRGKGKGCNGFACRCSGGRVADNVLAAAFIGAQVAVVVIVQAMDYADARTCHTELL